MSKLKKIIKSVIPRWIIDTIRHLILGGYSTKSYSQEGEDIILRRIFEAKKKVFT